MTNNTTILEKKFYGHSLLNCKTLVNIATSLETWSEILSFYDQLDQDEYVQYVGAYYRENLKRYQRHWFYLDIVNILYTASKLIQPKNYLEIGVRRGRSVSSVVKACQTVNVVACDMWIQNYAGMENPGETFVRNELKKFNHQGQSVFINGDSHLILPELFRQQPNLEFDLITVDGDHSEQGALDDLLTVIPQLAPGGILVFDDISHPAHPYLHKVWLQVMNSFPNLSHYEYIDSGYGIGFAIRQY